MLKKVLLILVVLVVCVAIFAVIVAMRPADFRISRTATIAAPPAAVFAQVNNLHNWEAWSPWAKLDPASKATYDGPPAGVGSSFAWAGNGEVGAGRMTITESQPDVLIQIRLDFLKPFKGTNIAEFTFEPVGDQTTITWSMFGKYNFITKAVGLFIDCDKMMGGFFEKGLASMKAITESSG